MKPYKINLNDKKGYINKPAMEQLRECAHPNGVRVEISSPLLAEKWETVIRTPPPPKEKKPQPQQE